MNEALTGDSDSAQYGQPVGPEQHTTTYISASGAETVLPTPMGQLLNNIIKTSGK